MLDVLQRIIREVYSATHLEEALAIAVRRIKEAMRVDACSVLIADGEEGDYVLVATDGLNPQSVGRVRLRRHEGLTGLVGERQEPVNVEHAAEHPRYRYFPETGEERYHAFLGVPIIHYRKVLGVLVAHQRAARRFSADEEALLVTIAAQLAGAIHDGLRGGGVGQLLNGATVASLARSGVAGAPGVAIGTVVLPSPFALLATVPDREVADPAAEEAAFREAVAAVQAELRESSRRLAGLLPPDAHAIFDIYVMLLGSERLIDDVIDRIRRGNWAPGALRDTIAEHAQVFEQMEDSYLRARAEDIRGIGQRLLSRLQVNAEAPRAWPARCVLVGEEITVAQVAEVPVERLAGIVCMRGSVLSHTAILARALGIPAVMGVGELPVQHLEGATVAVDGYQGQVFLRPAAAVLNEFRRLVQAEAELVAGLEPLRELPGETPDGVRIPLYANGGLLSDLEPALRRGAEGIGLFRTEFTFMVHESFPGEDEQHAVYRKVLEAFAPRPVTLRTLDIGGDKKLPYFPVAEDNALLGWRGIRVSLDHPEIFLTQLRAMLRANAGLGNLHVALPMVSRLKEVDDARALLARAGRELAEEGVATPPPAVGVVVEVPAAVYQIAALARRVDFLSIGTNDLTQYMLAVDRNNTRVSALYDSLHPAVIQAVQAVVQGARGGARTVGVCGEMAGDPAAVIMLLGMGVDTLSVPSPALSRVKWVLRSIPRRRAQELLRQALALEEPEQVRRLLNDALRRAGLGALVRVGG
ncbi:MAG: phosphoenolpyruvate--protein phosphotransferase [Pseudomonadota bacterium]|nr:phosphoenolpyruvate--protein phosphotransferase [Pseudomonadota bacterium]